MIITNRKFLTSVSTDCESIKEVSSIDEQLRKEYSKHPKAIGLSAPQLGILKRVFIIEIKGELVTCVSPKIISVADGKTQEMFEGCLSFPGTIILTNRPSDIIISDSSKVELKLEGIDAIAFQHELDHLDGILFFERGRIVMDQHVSEKINRNSLCPCGSGKKYKACHGLI